MLRLTDKAWFRVRLTTVAALIVLALSLLTRMLREPVSGCAASQLEATLVGDIATLLRAATDEERAALSLNESRLRAVWQYAVSPLVGQSTRVGRVEVEAFNHPVTQARASQRIRLSSGQEISMSVICNAASGTPKRAVVLEMLSSVWQVKWSLKGNRFQDKRDLALATLDGVRRDRARLTELGLRGTWGPKTGFRTWSDIEEQSLQTTDEPVEENGARPP